MKTINIGIVIYDDFDALDVAGPNQVFYFLQSSSSGGPQPVALHLIGRKKGEKFRSLEGLTWLVETGYKDAPDCLDVIFIPGGFGKKFQALLKNAEDPFYAFLKSQVASAKKAKKPQLICSVCVGALLLARAGLLDGYTCTTHWAFKNVLSLFSKVIVAPGFPRYVIDRNRVTGGGISSGIDEALAIVEILRGAEVARQIQLSIQYAPNPPHQSGDPSVASAATLHTVSVQIGATELYDAVSEFLK
ncbi:MAG: DJ-1/PfpI family protein [Saprospiraceae bacterium]